ncbi:MAG: DNA primase [Hadesarchaea archaeon]|nr:DNA primase [Hadesarchaea archaeon]
MKEGIETAKYLIKASLEVNGVVERPDVVGAIFGQTEGLLGNSLDLRELQKTGRIGRIIVNVESAGGKSKGEVIVPSNLDRTKTAIIGATLETIERIGPCEAKIQVKEIQDVREAKRKFIVNRAREILEKLEGKAPDVEKISKLVKEFGHVERIGSYEGLPAGPAVRDSDAIIVVEGRSDVLNLLRHGIRNTIAIEGTNVPKPIAELCKEKTATAFLDGDRGGDLILKELVQVAKVDYVARAPRGREVEKLEKDEIMKALRNKVPVEQAIAELEKKTRKLGEKEKLRKLEAIASKILGTSKAHLLDKNLEIVEETKVRELVERVKQAKNVNAIVFDGVISQRIADLAAEKGAKYLVGVRERVEEKPPKVQIMTIEELRKRAR